MAPPVHQGQSELEQNPALPGLGQGSAALVQRLAGALASKPRGYRPRTHHLLPSGQPKYVNRLIFESSPYLLQHAHNPVNWYPWAQEAFARAKRENKPVFLSIGYSTCHWCHVMERESFEDEQIAAFINQHFIAIKVDREERPDVDDLYMKAVQMMTGHGGWPMTVVMTPDKRPFFGGTYFPARDGDRGAHQGLLTILGELARAYRERGQEVVAQAQRVSQRIEAASAPQPPGDVPTASAIERGVLGATASFDGELGGFGRAPKFPRPALPELLLRYQRRTGNEQVLHMVTLTLDKMAAGGLYDHVAGGFHRYSTDAEWLVPHFEKMLYDNAQLVSLYLDAYQVTGTARYAEVVRDTLDYVAREMSAPEGGFYSATDADSATPQGHEEEGYFFTWTPAELSATLGPERAGVVASYFAVTPQGNFEGRNILHTPREVETVARELGLSPVALRAEIDAARPVLYRERSERPAPLRDDKILASWNGLMISAFARAGLILGEARYVVRAVQAADFLQQTMIQKDGALSRSFKDGHTGSRGYLDDYAFVIAGLLDVFEATAQVRHLELALALQTQLDSGFWDEQAGGYFMTSGKHEALLARDKPIYDGAEPSGNALAVSNLLRLAELTGHGEHGARAARALAAFSGDLQQSPGAHPKLLSALDASLDRPLEVFVIEPAAGADASALLNAFRTTYLPNRVFIHCREGEPLRQLARLLPALAEKQAIAGKVTAFVCERGRCELPTSDAAVFAQQLSRVHGY